MARHKTRKGVSALEVVMAIGSLFVIAMALYWLAQGSYVRLYQVIAIQNGSPYF